MFRQSIVACGLLALLAFLGPATTPGAAQEPAAKGHGAAAPSHETTPAEKREDKFQNVAETTQPGHEGAAVAHGESPNIMEVQSPLAIWTLIVFLLLMAVLGRFAWKPLMKALREREGHIEQVLLDSERARNEAEAISADLKRQLAQAADETRAMIDQARKDATAAADTIKRQAQADVEAARDRAEREIKGATDQALMEIWSKTADLAVSVAGRVLEKELGEADHRRLVEVAMSELPANGQKAHA